MTLRSDPKPDCRFCHGAGVVSVSKDPDVVDDCVCTDPPLSAEERVNIVEYRLGITLMPWQREWVLSALHGDRRVTARARRSGWKTVRRVVREAGHV